MNLVASAAELYTDPNAIARHYTRFDVAHRLLFTGHSHQAWPDCAWEGHTRAIDAAARLVDDKREAASAGAQRVRAGGARRRKYVYIYMEGSRFRAAAATWKPTST